MESDWHYLLPFKETNEFILDQDVRNEASMMSSEDFLKAMLAHLRVRNVMLPSEKCTILEKAFEVMLRDAVEHCVKTNHKKLLPFLKPLLKKLKNKNFSNEVAITHAYREIIKLAYSKQLISAPGEYVVLYEVNDNEN